MDFAFRVLSLETLEKKLLKSQAENCGDLLSQKFREINAFSAKLHCKLLSRNIFQVRVNFLFFYTVSIVKYFYFCNYEDKTYRTNINHDI